MKYTFSLILGTLFLFQGINALKILSPSKEYAVVINKPVTWFGAWKECNKINMRLVRFSSEEESNTVMTEIHKDPSFLDTWRFWTSGLTSKDDGIFCLDQAEFATYMKWNVGEPGGGFNFCVHLDYNFNFVDTYCDVECRFICEKDLQAD